MRFQARASWLPLKKNYLKHESGKTQQFQPRSNAQVLARFGREVVKEPLATELL